jgi:hypothetical protein
MSDLFITGSNIPFVVGWKGRPGGVGISFRRHAPAGREEREPAGAEGSSQS